MGLSVEASTVVTSTVDTVSSDAVVGFGVGISVVVTVVGVESVCSVDVDTISVAVGASEVVASPSSVVKEGVGVVVMSVVVVSVGTGSVGNAGGFEVPPRVHPPSAMTTHCCKEN